jgi:type III restriction enzyme
MKFELKEFQVSSARSIVAKLEAARNDLRGGDLQAIVLSAPTGSGKTITLAAVIDWTFGGDDGVVPRPNTSFL